MKSPAAGSPSRDTRRRSLPLGLAAVAVLAALACSRSSLDDTRPQGTASRAGTRGVGTSSAGTSSAGTGGAGGLAATSAASGSGGRPGPCVALTQVGAIATVEQPAGFTDVAPALAPSSDDGTEVAIALVRHPLQGDVTNYHIESARLKPWSAWPAGGIVGPTTPQAFVGQGTMPNYLVAPGHGDSFALVWYQAGPLPTHVPQFELATSNLATLWGSLALTGGAPMFLARGSAGVYLVGEADPPSPGIGSILAKRVPPNPATMPVLPIDTNLGCATAPIVAGAVPYGSGWLVALSNAPGAPNIGCGGAIPGPPTRIDVVFVGGDGKTSFVLGVDAGAPVSGISVAPHPLGAFVVWRVDTGGATPPLRWMRVDVPGAGLIGPGDVTAPALMPSGGFATAALGTNLVVAWGSDPANNPPDLVLSVLDEAGSVVAQGGIVDRFVPPLSLVAAPKGHGVVVAWHEPTSPGGPTAVRLARFDCAGGS